MLPAARFAVAPISHRVRFHSGFEAVLDAELQVMGAESYCLVSGPGGGRRFRERTGGVVETACAGEFTEAVSHVPEEVAERAAGAIRASSPDVVVAFGGGAALDTAKAACRVTGHAILAIPTNFSGSEVTPNFGLTAGGRKIGVVDPKVLPRTVLYDATLVATIPPRAAVCSGVNAMAHAVEALYAANANPFTSAIAVAGVGALVRGLRRRANGVGAAADAECLTGAWMCGEVLAQAGMALHHRICHVLGGAFGLTHAEAHTVVLPYAVAFNQTHAPELARLEPLFPHASSLASGVAAFARDLGAPTSLAELGLRGEDIPQAARLALATPLQNPRPVTEADVAEILSRAFSGAAPT